MEKYPVVILCGGMGTRLREETEFMPKPLVQIGGKPILWHIMKHYSHYGFKDFILCLGYKGEMIKDYFLKYDWMSNDFTLSVRDSKGKMVNHTKRSEDWSITFADTGLDAPTGARIKKIQRYVKGDSFLATYGDGVSDVNLRALADFHKKKGKVATITGMHPWSKYGTVTIDSDFLITRFNEKPILKDIINGGYFAFETKIFDFIKGDVMLEKEPFEKLAAMKQMVLHKHGGFWHCMDTYKDYQDLNAIWNKGNAPWKIWE